MTQATINNNLKPVGFLVNLSAKYSRKELTINFCSIWFEENKKVFHENDSSRTISCEYFIDEGTNTIFSPSPERIFPPNRITYAKQEKVFHRKRLSNNRGRGGSDGYLCLNRSRARHEYVDILNSVTGTWCGDYFEMVLDDSLEFYFNKLQVYGIFHQAILSPNTIASIQIQAILDLIM